MSAFGIGIDPLVATDVLPPMETPPPEVGEELPSAPEPPSVPDYGCPECGQVLPNAAGLGAHRRSKHGVVGQGRIRSSAKKECPLCGKKLHPASLPRHLDKHSLQAEPKFAVDDIFGEVVKLLYPKGDVPVAHLPSLIEWRTATERLLRAVE